MKVYEFTEISSRTTTTGIIDVKTGLNMINRYMMQDKNKVKEMSQISRGSYEIVLKSGVTYRLIQVEKTEEPAEWVGTASRPWHLHRFPENDRARCNSRIRPRVGPRDGDHEWGIWKNTKAEVLDQFPGWTFCSKCEDK